MARIKKENIASHPFRNKLLLNQWVISLFGIDPLIEHKVNDKVVRPFHKLAADLRTAPEGLTQDHFHYFYHLLRDSDFFRWETCALSLEELHRYEENIITHTAFINQHRQRPIVWKYYQWLSLLFTEIYLDRYFRNPQQLRDDLNHFVNRFNQRYPNFLPVPLYQLDDLNKICLQNATGSGKTLLMHVNLLQYNSYAKFYRKTNPSSYAFLLTPNERLSDQHELEFKNSSIYSQRYSKDAADAYTDIYLLEIQKLSDTDGPSTIATRNLGDNNLLLVDEGHAGISGKNAKKEEAAWMKNRAMLCSKGFSFEYSATFGPAVAGTGHEDDYAKAVLFDYSYRYFYEDGYGKDYQIFNIPQTFDSVRYAYLIGALLKYFQQLLIYENQYHAFLPFHLEKPLWVFVGSTVSGGSKLSQDDKEVATDIALIIEFIADFLANQDRAIRTIDALLTKTGQETGMLDSDNYDFFHGAFDYIARTGISAPELYTQIVTKLFNAAGAGRLTLERIKGNSGEIVLKAGLTHAPFGLINVGSPKELCDHIRALPLAGKLTIKEDSEYTEAMFASIKESSSPVNLLIGSKKFVEGWDCWRVSTLGLMHVGKTEGAQIIQLFGRGVRLKGYQWSLKRSGHVNVPNLPQYIEELELLNVFGIEANFMQKFRDYLKEEGLPGNERRHVERIPLNVTYDFGKKLKILRPKKKSEDGTPYEFKKDAPIPQVGEIPQYLLDNPVVMDYYPRIQTVASKHTIAIENTKLPGIFRASQLAMLDFTELYFDLERFKRERAWYNLNITIEGIRTVFSSSGWYRLFIPQEKLNPSTFAEVESLRKIAAELLRRYTEKLYDYCNRAFMEPRMEIRELTSEDANLPKEKEYHLIVDADDSTLIASIQRLKNELTTKRNELIQYGGIRGISLTLHLFEPLFHVKTSGQVTVLPVTLNQSEFQFVDDIKNYVQKHQEQFHAARQEIFLLRNLSRGQGIGFFEAANFHPDFILWVLEKEKQYISFIEPHGLIHEDQDSEKIKFARQIKAIENRIGDHNVVLNSFILSVTPVNDLLNNRLTQAELENKNILFMSDGWENYLAKLFRKILKIEPA